MTRPVIKGIFKEGLHEEAIRFSASHEFDRKLYRYDIRGSIAWAKMLKKIGILNRIELDKIVGALKRIEKNIDTGKFLFNDNLEDIHMHIEAELKNRIGLIAKKLHTGRSRNEQVALDERLYCRDKIKEVIASLKKLQKVLLKKTKENIDVIIPGYTHLQQAQPISAGHYFLAYVEKFARDIERLLEISKRVDVLVMGSSALAGTTINVDRNFLARELGFKKLSPNSLDAVSDRDFVIEIIFSSALIGMHLSRLAEDIVIWKSIEFDYLDNLNGFCTGSSLMPQKANPDIAELVRGKTARLYGNLVQILTLMKALPMTYNRDMQEDKEHLFDSVDTVLRSLEVFTHLIGSLKFKKDNILMRMSEFVLATDIAEYLVNKKMAFRDAHETVGKIVCFMMDNKKTFSDMTLQEFQKFSKSFDKKFLSILNVNKSVDARVAYGGTSRKNVRREMKNWEKRLSK
ncbi:MAG: argininosuccinate lyase [Candidatus Aureabacteria bacterium]|nr:argininosuccinate lyase [Candidatus Auribacterota bacterium]